MTESSALAGGASGRDSVACRNPLQPNADDRR